MQAKLFRRMILFAIAAVAYAALPAPQASAQYVHPLVAECRAAFAKSPATTHCPELIGHAVRDNPGGPSNTCWYAGNCALTVKVDGADTSFSVSYDSSVYISPADFPLLDVCFAKSATAGQGGQPGWTMKLRAGCADGETDAATAKSEGLPAAGSN